MKAFLNGFKKLLGVGLYLLAIVLLVEGVTVFVRQWFSHPILLTFGTQTGLTVIFIGMCLVALAWFNHSLNLIKVNLLDGERKLVTTGPFKYVRHPLYAILLLTLLPLTIVWSADWVFVAAWILVMIISHNVVRFEERGLAEEFGEEYTRYCHYVPALLPYKGNGGKRYQTAVCRRSANEKGKAI